MIKKRKVKKIILFIRDKYVITSFVLLFWIAFFDKNDLISQMDLSNKLELLNDEKQYYLAEIEKTKSDMKELMTNPKDLEKFAREKYLMKKENEDIFVIVEKKVASTDSKATPNN